MPQKTFPYDEKEYKEHLTNCEAIKRSKNVQALAKTNGSLQVPCTSSSTRMNKRSESMMNLQKNGEISNLSKRFESTMASSGQEKAGNVRCKSE